MRDLDVVHFNEDGSRRVTTPVAQAGGVPLTERAAVWAPLRHPSERSIVTWWWAATTGKQVGCRSLQRLSVAMLLDFNPKIVDMAAWTARLEWTEDGRRRSLVPDFFVRTASGATVVIACPPGSGSSRRWEQQAEVLQEACRRAGWLWGSPRLPNKTALANLRWVARYRHPRNADGGVEKTLLDVFSEPRPLLEGVPLAGPRLTVLPRLYHLLWRGALTVDWSVPLGPSCVVRRGRGGPEAMHRPFTVREKQ